MQILLCLDPMSCMLFDNDVEREYDAVQADFNKMFPNTELNFERDVYPHALANACFDIYVFDFGGMLPGSTEGVEANFREFIRQADDHPNAAFVLYSSFSEHWYKDLMQVSVIL